ncbi:tail fiber assembly protein [Desulfocurvus sp. DL9XJH121]
MSTEALYAQNYKCIMDVTDVPEGKQRGKVFHDSDTGTCIERTYELEDIPGRFQVWDGDAGAWTLDRDAAAGAARSERNRRLTGCDWTQVADSPLAEEEREAWAAYRQTLRDLPAQPGFPETINWPAEPAQEA